MFIPPTIRKKRVFLGAGMAGLVILAFMLVPMLVDKPKPVNGEEVLRAVQQYCRAHRAVPPTVTFTQLTAEGYLSPNVLKQFGASEVTIYMNFTNPTPQAFVMDALMPDGTHTTLLTDGSVQGFPKK
jgi:hypothetical protein